MPDSIVGTEYLPNVHIDKITVQPSGTVYKVQIIASCYDYEEKTWSSDQKFTGYLSILLVLTANRNLIQSIDSGDFKINSSAVGLSKDKLGFSSAEQSTVQIRSEKYEKYKFTFNFTTTINISHLSCYAASVIDIDQLKQNERLNLSYISNLSYMGSVKSEKILENGTVPDRSFVFRDAETGEVWSGPVHQHPEKGFMEGSQHSSRPHRRLTRDFVSNNKVQFLFSINYSIREDLIRSENAPGLTNALPRSTNLSQAPVQPVEHSNVHQEEYIEDTSRNVSNTFVTDIASIALQESTAASVMSQNYPDKFTQICDTTNIQNIEINRFPIKISPTTNRIGMFVSRPDFSEPTLVAKSHNNRQKVKNKTLFQISPTERVAVDPLTLGNNSRILFFNGRNLTLDMLKNAPKIGKVEQIDLSLPLSLRPIAFTDYSIKNAKDGRYKYRVKISMEDQHLLYCKEMLKKLLMMENKIQNLYNVLIMKNVFEGDNFKIEFLEEFYSQYNILVNTESGFVEGEFNTQELKDSYLIKSFEILNEAERLIGVQQQSLNMINNLNLFSTDLDNILNTSNYFKQIIDLFKQTYKLSDGESYEKSSSKSRKERGKIEKIITLRNEYKRELLMPIGINYINMNSQTEGMPIINLLDFDSRTNKEVSKFFNTSITTNSDSLSALPSSLRNAMSNIEDTKFMNFTPATVLLGGKEVDTTEINPKSFDADFFNTLRITSAALETENNVTPENNIDEQQLEKYLDSREYLGDTTKFNNIILSSLRLKPKLLPKIRSKFKFLDNAILKSKKRNISLKTFDLKQPENYLTTKLLQDPAGVPLQIKALSLLNTQMTNFDLNTIDFDPLTNPQTQEVFMQNYLNIGKIQALMGFEKVNGRFVMDKPIYKEINTEIHEKLKNINVLCRIIPQSLDGFGVDYQKYNIHDKVFIMHSQENAQIGEEDVES